jgi:hypothetical protein
MQFMSMTVLEITGSHLLKLVQADLVRHARVASPAIYDCDAGGIFQENR